MWKVKDSDGIRKWVYGLQSCYLLLHNLSRKEDAQRDYLTISTLTFPVAQLIFLNSFNSSLTYHV